IKPEAWKAVWVPALAALVIAFVIGWLASRDMSDLHALQSHGVEAHAIITGKRRSGGRSTSYYLAYTMRTPNGFVDDEDQVKATLYEERHKGDVLLLTVLPEHPETHRLGRVDDFRVQDRGIAWTFGILGDIGIFGIVITGMLYDYRRELHLVQRGIPTPST